MPKKRSPKKISEVVLECSSDTKGEKLLQDVFLEILCENKIPISVFLINGIKLQGYLDNFDQKILVLKNSLAQAVTGQIIYKRAISTVMPIYPVELSKIST